MLSIVIPVLARDPEIIQLAATLLEGPVREADEVIVVANGPLADQLPADIRINDPDVGYGHAVNMGLRRTAGDWLAVGSCDLELPAGWAEPMMLPWALTSPMDRSHDRDTAVRGAWWAALWVMPAQVVSDIGMLDETLGLRICAQDYAIRAHLAGWAILRADVHVDHLAFRHSVHHQYEAVRAEQAVFEARYGGASNYKQWHDMNCGCSRG